MHYLTSNIQIYSVNIFVCQSKDPHKSKMYKLLDTKWFSDRQDGGVIICKVLTLSGCEKAVEGNEWLSVALVEDLEW